MQGRLYRVAELVGKGGMGQIYRAHNARLGRDAALKVLLPEFAHRPDILRRFIGEDKAASALNDPNIIDVFDAGAFADGRPYLLMEYIDGGSLEAFCQAKGPLPLKLALTIFAQLASALDAAHTHVPPIKTKGVRSSYTPNG